MWHYPFTPRKTVTETIHGRKIRDPYRWLEKSNDVRVKRWVARQNQFTVEVLKKHGTPNRFQKELARYFDIPGVGMPFPVKGRYFWAERKPHEDQMGVYVKMGLRGQPRELVNPNKLSKRGLISLDYWHVSPQGRYFSYGLSEKGTEMATLYIKEVATGKNLREKIPYARYASLRWLPDETGFYYTRHPKPGTVPKGDEHFYRRVYFHALGTAPQGDPLIFGAERPNEDMMTIDLSQDGRYLAIDTTDNWVRNDSYLYDTHTRTLSPIVEGMNAKFTSILAHGKIYLLTNYRADRFRVLVSNPQKLPKSIREWQVMIPERKELLLGVNFTKDRILVEYLANATSKVRIYDYQARSLGLLPLPKYSSLDWIGGREEEEEFFFRAESFYSTGAIFRWEPRKRTYLLYRKPTFSVREKDYQVTQEWFRSKDRVRVPMFIFHRRGIRRDGKNPAVLYGYGGFGASETPWLNRGWLPLMKRGLIFAVANIRGGGEFGESWHKAGILDKKTKSFDDFIAAAEHLIRRKYTNSGRLIIEGGSNGGLLVGGCLVKRPDLFKAVISKVPILDMIRFPKFLIAKRWVSEYGDPGKLRDFQRILTWSPYHNVRKGIEYPSVLLTTALNDRRVHPLHAWKMAALLQETGVEHVVLLRTETATGHGPGTGKRNYVRGQADTLAFAAWQLGMT